MRELDIFVVGWSLPVVYLMADVGSVGGGWLSGYLIRRGMQMIVVLIMSSIAIYALLNLAPGGPLSGLKLIADPKAKLSEDDIAQMERMLGIECSPYVNAIRVLMAELQRIASHAVAVGTYGMDLGAFTPFLHLLRDREKILDLFEWTCGARLLYNYNWVGGAGHDLPEGFLKACRGMIREYEAV